MTDSNLTGELLTFGELEMPINIDELHNIAVVKLQKLDALKKKNEHVKEEAEKLIKVLKDLETVKINTELEERKLVCRVHELEEELTHKREQLDASMKEVACLQHQLDTLNNRGMQDLKDFDIKMKMIFANHQQAYENYTQQNQDRILEVEREREMIECNVSELKEQLAPVREKFHNTFEKPNPQDADLAALTTIIKQMEADVAVHKAENEKLRDELKKREEEHQNVTEQLQKLKQSE